MRVDFAFEVRVAVGEPRDLGELPVGRRRIVPIVGGTFDGPRLKGVVMPGGADWQVVRPDGVTELEARYWLETDDGATISVLNLGRRRAPPEIAARLLAGEFVEPALYYFRATPSFLAPAGKHDWLTRSVFVADCERQPALVIVRVFEVL